MTPDEFQKAVLAAEQLPDVEMRAQMRVLVRGNMGIFADLLHGKSDWWKETATRLAKRILPEHTNWVGPGADAKIYFFQADSSSVEYVRAALQKMIKLVEQYGPMDWPDECFGNILIGWARQSLTGLQGQPEWARLKELRPVAMGYVERKLNA